MTTIHIIENDIVYCIICTEIIDDDTEDSFQCIFTMVTLYLQMTQLMLSFVIFEIINYYY